MKKTLYALLALILAVGLTPAAAHAGSFSSRSSFSSSSRSWSSSSFSSASRPSYSYGSSYSRPSYAVPSSSYSIRSTTYGSSYKPAAVTPYAAYRGSTVSPGPAYSRPTTTINRTTIIHQSSPAVAYHDSGMGFWHGMMIGQMFGHHTTYVGGGYPVGAVGYAGAAPGGPVPVYAGWTAGDLVFATIVAVLVILLIVWIGWAITRERDTW